MSVFNARLVGPAEDPLPWTTRAFCDLRDWRDRREILRNRLPLPTGRTPSFSSARPNAGHRTPLPDERIPVLDAENPLRGAWTFSL